MELKKKFIRKFSGLFFIFIMSCFLSGSVFADNVFFVRGDADDSISVDAQDALIVLKNAAKIMDVDDNTVYRADVNRNGVLEANDALWILKYAAKITNNLVIAQIPEYSDSPYVVIDYNNTAFSFDELTNSSYEYYSPLDKLGRCQVAKASVGQDIMPTEKRGDISSVTPSGWLQAKYDCISGQYLYNRSHLIGFQLTGENANELNLITGTRYLNVEGMLPFENSVAECVKSKDYHVAYKVTPVFLGDNLVASGVQIEAFSVDDNGKSVCFNVYCYNVQPQIEIEYLTGESWLVGTRPTATPLPTVKPTTTPTVKPTAIPTSTPTATSTPAVTNSPALEYFILNTNSKKIHKPTCSSASKISAANRKEVDAILSDLIDQGYSTCGNCFD